MTVHNVFTVYKTANGACTLVHVQGTTLWYSIDYHDWWHLSGWDEKYPPTNYRLVAKNVVFN